MNIAWGVLRDGDMWAAASGALIGAGIGIVVGKYTLSPTMIETGLSVFLTGVVGIVASIISYWLWEPEVPVDA